MAEQDIIYSSKFKSKGIFDFSAFYEFCYVWLTEEEGFFVLEKKYSEKLAGDAKNIDIEWRGEKKITDYFMFKIDVDMKIIGLTNVEVNQGGAKVSTNKGSVEVKIKGTLVRDYYGKFEKTAVQKFMRGIYEKWVIPSRVEQMEDKLAETCDKFMAQGKAFLDLQGKR